MDDISKDEVNVKDYKKLDYCSPKLLTSTPAFKTIKGNFGSSKFKKNMLKNVKPWTT